MAVTSNIIFIVFLILILLLIVSVIVYSSCYYKRNMRSNPEAGSAPIMVWRPDRSVNELHEIPPQYSARPEANEIPTPITDWRTGANIVEMVPDGNLGSDTRVAYGLNTGILTPPPLYESRAPSYISHRPRINTAEECASSAQMPVERTACSDNRPDIVRSETSTGIGCQPRDSFRSRLSRSQTSTRIQVHWEPL